MRRLSSCGSRAQLLCGMWDFPRPGLEPVSPALAGRFSTTAPPGKPPDLFLSCVSDLWYEVGGIGALPLGKKALSITPLELFTCWVCSVVKLFTCCAGSQKYTIVGTALSTTLTVGMLAIGPGVSQTLFSPGHQCRSTEVRSQDCSSHAPGPIVGTMEAAQTLAWLTPTCMCPQRAELLKPDPSQLQEHLSVQMFFRHWIYKAGNGGVNLWFAQVHREISALLP